MTCLELRIHLRWTRLPLIPRSRVRVPLAPQASTQTQCGRVLGRNLRQGIDGPGWAPCYWVSCLHPGTSCADSVQWAETAGSTLAIDWAGSSGSPADGR